MRIGSSVRSRVSHVLAASVVLAVALVIAACESSAGTARTSGPLPSASTLDQRFPDVVDARLVPTGDRRYDVVVTISSPYDTPARYADGWRVLGPDGTVLGTHDLLHDHANEQPFTRTQSGLSIPDGIEDVTIEGRDLVNGFGGATVTVPVPRG